MRWAWIAIASAWGCGATPIATGETARVDSPAPPPAGAWSGAIDLALGNSSFTPAGCVVQTPAGIACWGGPNLGHEIQRWGNGAMPGPRAVPGLESATRVVIGMEQVCGIAAGRAICSGGVDLGLEGVLEIALGRSHGCARLADGAIRCWGSPVAGALGTPGSPSSRSPPIPVALPGRARSIVAGGYGSCALLEDRSLWCWGLTPFATAGGASIPIARADVGEIERVAITATLGCVASHDRLRCVVRPHSDIDGPPVLRDLEPSLGEVRALSANGDIVCAIDTDRNVRCWGPGLFADPNERDARLPAVYGEPGWIVPGLDGAVRVAVFPLRVCALFDGGRVRCAGDNALGELGDGTLEDRATASWLVRHEPDVLPEPRGGVFGCTAAPDLRRSCRAQGDLCRLEPPAGYWAWGRGGGALCDQACIAEQERQLSARAVPICNCNCPSTAGGTAVPAPSNPPRAPPH